MKKTLLSFLVLISSFAFAAPGDTTLVTSLNQAQLTYWGADEGWGIFPDSSLEYRKILMDVTLGCASGGCSDWDYTVRIEAEHQTGIIDSALTPFTNFTVDGVAIPDTFYFSYDTTYITSWDVFTSSVDSNAVAMKTVLIYGDTNNHLVPTDTLYVWDANFPNDIYDNSGNVTGSANVPYDSFLVTSTIYRYQSFEVKNEYELGRFMTPYGSYMANNTNGFNNNWTHKYTYEVTDFAQMFHDSVKISAFYAGWSSGFSVTVNFRLIEGTPPRDVIHFENMYRSGPDGWRSDDPAVFEATRTPALNIPIHNNTVTARAKITPSGHGFVNSQNCAEFCNREYYLKTGGITRFTQDMWRDDCGLTPIYPQGGTWLYDRANWCPGNKTLIYDHELTPFITPGTDLNIDLDLEMIPLTVPTNEVPPNYIIDAQLFQYGAPNFNVDAEMIDIISPSTNDQYSRKNPICGKPVIEIRNGGATALTNLTITYGVKGATPQTMTWGGNLAFMETEQIELDVLTDWDGTSNTFEVSLSNPNGGTDEYSDNDAMETDFESVTTYPNELYFLVGTNNRPNENEWYLYDAQGTEVFSNFLTQSNKYHYDTLDLSPGCYEFLLIDTDKDGLAWWANNDEGNGGPIRIGNSKQNVVYEEFIADFGTEIRYQFRITDSPDGISSSIYKQIDVFPNPSTGVFNISSKTTAIENFNIKVYNLVGEVVYNENTTNTTNTSIDLSQLPVGTYVLNIETSNGTYREKISLVK